MSLIRFFSGLFCIFLFQHVVAEPSFEILNSCLHGKPENRHIIVTRLEGGGFSPKPVNDCDEPYEIHSGNHLFSYFSCNEKDYLLISDQKYFIESSINRSVNPEVKPTLFYPHLSKWMRIDDDTQSYLCIASPLSQSGVGANERQYFIVENAFKPTEKPVIYYYFFTKNVYPVTIAG